MRTSSSIGEASRSWLSLWLVVHFFILSVCLIQNNSSSFLIRRLHQLTAPYSMSFAQDYGARPIEMTTGQLRSYPHRIQLHHRNAAVDQWETVKPTSFTALEIIDSRWRNFEHMLAVAASEDNEELVYIVFEHAVRAQRLASQAASDIDAIRLVRTATLSFQQDQLYRDGQLPADDLNDEVLYEARIIAIPDNPIKLLPVLEKTRRTASLEVVP